jgi:hypothetical protein
MIATTTISDLIVARVQAMLPNHTRLPNGINIERNNENFLKKGWGISINEGVNTPRYLACQSTTVRTYTISITRKFYAREFDTDSKYSVEKELFEDLHLVVKDLQKNNTLNDGIYIMTYEGDNGIEELNDFIYAVRIRMSVQYSEDFA